MRALYALPLVLAACAQPEPILDYNAPYEGKYAPVASVRPEARPMQRRWAACANALINDDCGNGETLTAAPDIWTYQGAPLPTPEPPSPGAEPTPAPPTPGPEPEPAPPEPEPPEVHEPPPEECPA